MTEQYPKRLEHVTFQELPEENELMVVDPEKGEARVLNADAGGVWLLCDGTRSREDLLGFLQQSFPAMNREDLQRRLDETIAFLMKEGLVA